MTKQRPTSETHAHAPRVASSTATWRGRGETRSWRINEDHLSAGMITFAGILALRDRLGPSVNARKPLCLTWSHIYHFNPRTRLAYRWSTGPASRLPQRPLLQPVHLSSVTCPYTSHQYKKASRAPRPPACVPSQRCITENWFWEILGGWNGNCLSQCMRSWDGDKVNMERNV